MKPTHSFPIPQSLPDPALDGIQALKMDELLPPISRWTPLGGWLLISTIGIALGLSAVARYSVTVKAEASIRPDGELRIVQSELEGTVKHIQVQENQPVQQGDVIAVLDDSTLQSQKSHLQNNIQQSQLQLSQLDAQIQLMTSQILAEARATEQAIAALYPEISRSQNDYQERKQIAEANFEEAQAMLHLAQDQLARYQQLAAVGAVSISQFKEREAAVQMAIAQVERAKAALSPSQAATAITQQQIEQQQSRGAATLASLEREKKSLLQRQAELQSQLLREQQELDQVARDIESSTIRATSDGIILQLNLSNPSQVVRVGDSIAQIAPTNIPLVVKALVPNKSISKVTVGQPAQIRADACPYSDYGTLRGTVTAIAPDSQPLQSSNTNFTLRNESDSSNNRTFTATIQLNDSVLTKGERECSLQAGMEATANIIAREETFLRFVIRKLRLFSDL